jgi:hypothetical protein
MYSPRPAEDAYLLRLCLDLKLDALLLTLGAAASDPAAHPPQLNPPLPSAPVPDGIRLTPEPVTQPVTEPVTEEQITEEQVTEPVTEPVTAGSGADVTGRVSGVTVDRVIDLTTDPPTDHLATQVVRSSPSSGTPSSGPPTSGPPSSGTAWYHEAGPDASPVPPWQRWLREDVDAARALARELLVWGGGLPSSMDQAAALSQDDPDPAILALLSRLEAFHSAMRSLLGDVGASTGTATGSAPPATGSTHLHMMIRHCRRRLTELELLQVQVAEQRPACQVTVSAATRSLPGEFLG